MYLYLIYLALNILLCTYSTFCKYLHFLLPVFFMGELVSYLCLFVNNIRQRVLTIWVTWWMSYKRQELLTLREHLGSSRFLICEFLIFLDFCIVFCLSWSWSCFPNIATVSWLAILDYSFCCL